LNPQERIAAIAKDYAAKPENTIIVSPDNRSRQQINQAVLVELQNTRAVAADNQKFETLTPRSDITEPTGLGRYATSRGMSSSTRPAAKTSESSAAVPPPCFPTNARENTVTVQRGDGQTVTYDSARLRGVNVFHVTEREFATGDGLQFTAPAKQLGIVRRDLGTITKLDLKPDHCSTRRQGGMDGNFLPLGAGR